MSHPTQLLPAATLQVWSDEQIAAFEERIVERVTEALTVNWMPRRPMTIDETAEFFSVSTKTIREWTNRGALSCWKFGHTVLYLPDDVAAFLGRGGDAESRAA